MPDFEAGTIVRVPFPYTDSNTRQHRPALVVSNGAIGENGALLWIVMITSAANRRWANDVPIDADYKAYGLPVPSLIRTTKIATIDTSAADRLGELDSGRLAAVRAAIAQHLPLV
jgi:mRNA interferase MazF